MQLTRGRATPHLAALVLAATFAAACNRPSPAPERPSGEHTSPTPTALIPERPAALDAGSDLPDAAPLPSPTADSSRPKSLAHCLEPPVIPALAGAPTLSGLERSTCPKLPRVQLLSTPGKQPSRPAPIEREAARLDGLKPHIEPAFAALGIQNIGVRSCCDSGAPDRRLCLSIETPLCSQPLATIAQTLAAKLPAQAPGAPPVTLRVEYTGLLGPRCEASAPSCEPIPYHFTTPRPDERRAGLFTPPYVPGAERRPVIFRKHPATGEPHTDPSSLSLGTCTHDGECVRMGCGNHCAAWYTPPFAAHCPAYGDLTDAYCGCLSGHCAWFTQREQLDLVINDVQTSSDLPIETARQFVNHPWIEQQLIRCHRAHPAPLPLDLTLQLRVDPRGNMTSPQLHGASPPFTRCALPEMRGMTGPNFEAPKAKQFDITAHLTLRARRP